MGVNQMCATTLLTLDLAQDDRLEGVGIKGGWRESVYDEGRVLLLLTSSARALIWQGRSYIIVNSEL